MVTSHRRCDNSMILAALWLSLILMIPSFSVCSGFLFSTTSFQVLLEANPAGSVSSTMSSSSQYSDLVADGWILNDPKDAAFFTGTNQRLILRVSNRSTVAATTRRSFLGNHNTVDGATKQVAFHGILAPFEHRLDHLSMSSLAPSSSSSSTTTTTTTTWIWEINQSTITGSHCVDDLALQKNELFCLCGDWRFVWQALRQLPSGSPTIWRPSHTGQQDPDDPTLVRPVDVWNGRSAGILGIVLPAPPGERLPGSEAKDDDERWQRLVVEWTALYRKFKLPCSAMDYPPTIFMIGEDEIS